MAYCSNCNFDYKTNVCECPDCNSPLVHIEDSSSSVATYPDDSWVVIAGISNGFSREIVKGTLQSSNIPSMFINSSSKEEISQISTMVNQSLEGVEGNLIIVPREFKDEAALIISGILGDNFNFNKDISFF